MPTFKFRVIETRTISVDYSIEADTLLEACEKAENGETTSEVELPGSYEVVNRTIEQALGNDLKFKTYDVIVTRDLTESCTMLIEAANLAAAHSLAFGRALTDTDLVWEQDNTPNAGKVPYVTHCEVQSELES